MGKFILNETEQDLEGDSAELARAIGTLEERTKHHAEQLAEHTGLLTDSKEGIEWLKTRVAELQESLGTVTGPVWESLKNLETKVDALAASAMEKAKEEQEKIAASIPPQETTNRAPSKAEAKGIGGHLRALFHRLA